MGYLVSESISPSDTVHTAATAYGTTTYVNIPYDYPQFRHGQAGMTSLENGALPAISG